LDAASGQIKYVKVEVAGDIHIAPQDADGNNEATQQRGKTPLLSLASGTYNTAAGFDAMLQQHSE
jgi:hypothetical protein